MTDLRDQALDCLRVMGSFLTKDCPSNMQVSVGFSPGRDEIAKRVDEIFPANQ